MGWRPPRATTGTQSIRAVARAGAEIQCTGAEQPCRPRDGSSDAARGMAAIMAGSLLVGTSMPRMPRRSQALLSTTWARHVRECVDALLMERTRHKHNPSSHTTRPRFSLCFRSGTRGKGRAAGMSLALETSINPWGLNPGAQPWGNHPWGINPWGINPGASIPGASINGDLRRP